VAQINASTWAISSRGFNGQYADKLLVLGGWPKRLCAGFRGKCFGECRTPCSRTWDRIEIIRGPGATLCGRKRGERCVINIITKSAKETQGLLVSTSAGNGGAARDEPAVRRRQLGSNVYTAFLLST